MAESCSAFGDKGFMVEWGKSFCWLPSNARSDEDGAVADFMNAVMSLTTTHRVDSEHLAWVNLFVLCVRWLKKAKRWGQDRLPSLPRLRRREKPVREYEGGGTGGMAR